MLSEPSIKEPSMIPVEETYVDKTNWERGEWDAEPDRVEWRSRGFACLIVRNPHMGNLCGYVGVNPGHPWHGTDWNDLDCEVHGGITYAAPCQEGGKICHVPQPGEPETVWWLGFDCAHCGDYADMGLSEESRRRYGRDWGSSYKSLSYVRHEVESLARQAEEAAKVETARAD